jgi:hypothetical protein
LDLGESRGSPAKLFVRPLGLDPIKLHPKEILLRLAQNKVLFQSANVSFGSDNTKYTFGFIICFDSIDFDSGDG